MKPKQTFLSTKYRSMLLGGTAMAVMVSALIMADALIAGVLLGEDAVAGVNLVLPVYSLASFFAMAFSLGVPILYSGRIGAFRREEAERVFGMGLLMTAAAGAAMFLALRWFGEAYLNCFGPGEQALRSAREYLVWMKYVVLLLPAAELLHGMVYADGDEPVSVAGSLLSGLGNVLLSIPLCYFAGMRGLGLATFLSQLLAVAAELLHFLRRSNSLRLKPSFSFRTLREILKYSIVDACTYLFLFLFTAAMNRYVIRSFGAGMLILASVVALVKEAQLIFDGIGEAVTPILSVYLGEKTYPGVREVWGYARRTANLEGAAVSALLIVFAPLIVRAFDVSDPQLARLACRGLRIVSLSLVFSCHLYLEASYDILADRIPLGVLVSALRDVALPLPLAVIGGALGGVTGMFCGLMLSQPAAFGLSYLYIRRRYGEKNYPLFLADREGSGKRLFYEFEITPENVVQVRDRLGKALEERGCPGRTVSRTMLLFEELFMAVYDRNPGRRVLAECAVEPGKRVRLIEKDDGAVFDLTREDRRADSLRAYVISNLIGAFTPRRAHFLTLSFNRNVFEIE